MVKFILLLYAILPIVTGDIPEENKIYFIKSASDNSYLKAFDDFVPCRKLSRVSTTMDMSNVSAMKWRYKYRQFQMLIPDNGYFKHNEFYEFLPPPSCTPATHGHDILPVEEDTFRIKSRYIGLCLESYGIGTPAAWWTCGSTTYNQLWKFEETLQ